MPRPTTSEFEALLPACETRSTLEMRLRDDSVFRFVTGGENLVIGGNEYQPLLLKTGDLKESGGAATNRVSVEISNVSRDWSIKLASSVRLLELADVQIKRFYRDLENPSNNFHKHFFGGKLVGAEASETSLTFDVIPKTTASGTSAADRTLSPPCAWIFKDPHTCKYTGELTTCNHQLKSKFGCMGRNNTEHFGGWTSPDNPTQAAPGSGTGPGGIGTGVCFLKGTLVFTPRGEQPIENIKPFFKVYSFNEATREIEADTVEEVFKHFVTTYFSILFEDGSFAHVTPEHPFLSESGEFVSVDKMNAGERFWRFIGGRWKLVTLKKIGWNRGEAAEVYNFRVMRNHNYFANRFAVHNTKQPVENF